MTDNNKIPTNKEIEDAEARLKELKAQRENAKQTILSSLRSKDIIESLNPDEAIGLMRLLQAKFAGARRKVRGSPVSPTLKAQLEKALKEGQYTLSQLERMFGLSVSYISRIKKDLGLTGVKNVYTDKQLDHHQHAA